MRPPAGFRPGGGRPQLLIGRRLDENLPDDAPVHLGLPGAKPLLGLDDARSSPTVIVVEGSFDQLTLNKWGFPGRRAGNNSCDHLDWFGGAGASETMAMRYGGGARLGMESLLPRGIAAPERRTGVNRSAHAKAPHPPGGNLTSGALDNAGPHAQGWRA